MQDTTYATRITDQLDSLGEQRDERDAKTIHSIFSALRTAEKHPVVTRALREAIQKIWQEPRMKRAKGLKHSHNKPLDYPWSPKARDLYFRWLGDRSFSLKDRLDLEHVHPLGLTVSELLGLVADPRFTAQDTLDWLRRKHSGLSFAVLTRAEHQGMGKLKAADVDTSAEAFARYREGCGLEPADLIAVTADPRWEAARD